MKFKTHCLHVFDLIKKSPFFFLFSILSDFAFVFLHGVIIFALGNKIAKQVLAFGLGIAQYSPRLFGPETTVLEVVLGKPELKALLNDILGLVLLTVLAFYLLYSLFQGLAWYFSHRVQGKLELKGFLHKFFIVSIFWVLVLGVFKGLEFGNVYGGYFSLVEVSWITNGLMWVFLLTWIYFSFISYSFLPESNVIKKAWKSGRARKLLIPALQLLACFVVLVCALLLVAKVSEMASNVIGLFTVFPLIAFARLYFITIK